MSVTIMEVLQNVQYNLRHNGSMGLSIARNQLENAIILLEKGYPINTKVDLLLEEYDDDLNNAPEKQEQKG